jgi:uncharacterized protein with PIN domain
MLGSLARRLRLLGIDTAYEVDAVDSELKFLVRSQNKILLTKNKHLAGSLDDRAWMVEGGDVREEFNSIAYKFSTARCQVDPFSRCIDCNDLLDHIDPPQAEGKVPPYILQTHKVFSRCPRCGKIFWEGTHREKMEEEVKWMRGLLETGGEPR